MPRGAYRKERRYGSGQGRVQPQGRQGQRGQKQDEVNPAEQVSVGESHHEEGWRERKTPEVPGPVGAGLADQRPGTAGV